MTRLRYIADRPRGPRGGNNDARHLFTWVESASREAGIAKPITFVQRQKQSAGVGIGVVRLVDLDELLIVRPEPSPHDMFEWHENRAFHHEGEMLRLQPEHVRATASLLSTADIASLREVIDEWELERLTRKKTPAEHRAFFVLRDLRRARKLG